MEECEKLIELFLSDWIEFVIVTLTAPNRKAKPHRAGGIHSIDDISGVVFLWNGSAFEVDHVIAIEATGNFLLNRGIGQQITGQLLDRKPVKGKIVIEGIDDPFAP